MRQLPCIKQNVLRYRMKAIVTIPNTFENNGLPQT